MTCSFGRQGSPKWCITKPGSSYWLGRSSVGTHNKLGMDPEVSVNVDDVLEDTDMEPAGPTIKHITNSPDTDSANLACAL